MFNMLQMNKILISTFLILTVFAVIFTIVIQTPKANAASANYTQTKETIGGVNYSVITVTYSGDDAGPAVNEAIAAVKNAAKPVILDFPTATYNFKDSSALDAQYYISNASTASQTSGGWRKVGLLINNISDLTIRGNDSTLMFHGVMTPIVFDYAVNVNMNNISFDFKRPVMSEMTVAAVGSNYIEMNVHPDSLYKIVNNRLQWTGEVESNGNATDNWVARGYANVTQVQEYDPNTKKTWRTSNPIANAATAQDLGDRRVRFNYASAPKITIGHVYQIRNDVRKEQGAFIYRSKNVIWTGVNFYAAPGLGIVGQYSENLTFDQLNFAPKTGSGRTNASMADFMQISGCKGQITVNNSNFFGAHDDPINIHGTHLQIVDKPASNQIKVRFNHSQSWGFDAFAVNDSIDFIKGSTLLPSESAIIYGVTRVDDNNILLTLDKNVPSSITVNDYFVENATWNPNVTISNSTFESIPTRGILVTTRGNVLIDHNRFNRMEMSAILIADDASSWYESGMVRNVTISNNTFNNNGNSVIDISPSAPSTNPDQTVHSNISIRGNSFYKTGGTTSIFAGSVNGFNFTNNIAQEGGVQINAKGSKNVTISGNTFAQSGVTKGITLSYMYSDTDTIDTSQGFTVTRNNNYVPVVPNPNDIPQSQMTATATSQHSGFEASKTLDGANSTMWHTEWSPLTNLPQSITINLGGNYSITKLRYLPRQDSDSNGVITDYTISTSTDGVTFTDAVSGTWADDKAEKIATFNSVSATYVKLTATRGHGGFASAAELNIERVPQNFQNLSLSANATASSQYNSDFTPSKANDGNTSTQWSPQSGTGVNEWLQMDFGTNKIINQVTIKEKLNRTAGYKVQYYNGSSWVDIVTGTTINSSVTHSFVNITAQKIRLYISATQIDSNGWGREPNITELIINGQSLVTSISVNGTGGANSLSVNGTLQMQANVLPSDANSRVTWNVFEADGITSTDKATINTNGLLTAIRGGTVKVVAAATDGSGVKGSTSITIESDQIDVALDKASLAIGYAEGDSEVGVTKNVNLITSGANGTIITWSSDTTSVIDANGKVTRPLSSESDATVRLSVTITKGTVSDTRTFVLIVLKGVPPVDPVLSADITAPTNRDVTVTISYPDDTVLMEYKVGDNGEWTAYGAPVVVSENSTVYARGTDAAGNVSNEICFTVSNIDHIAPIDATLAVDTTAPTNQGVTVMISYPADASLMEYKVGASGAWTAYTSPVVVSDNDTVYARGIDAVGNVSNVTSITVSNIHKIAPVTTATLSPAAPNGKNGWYTTDVAISLSVSASVYGGSVTTEYQVNDGQWIIYTGSIPAFGDGTYKLGYRSKDQASNVEQLKTVEFKVDKTSPTLSVQLDKTSIWPANHKMVTIHVLLNSSDTISDVGSVVLTSITSNQSDSGKGDIQADFGTAATSFSLRAEKSRIYTITYTATDKAGNKAVESVTVTVPHDQSGNQ